MKSDFGFEVPWEKRIGQRPQPMDKNDRLARCENKRGVRTMPREWCDMQFCLYHLRRSIVYSIHIPVFDDKMFGSLHLSSTLVGLIRFMSSFPNPTISQHET